MNRNLSYLNGQLVENKFGNCAVLALSAAVGMPFKHAERFVLSFEDTISFEHNGRTEVGGVYVMPNLHTMCNKLFRNNITLYRSDNPKNRAVFNRWVKLEQISKDFELEEFKSCKLETFAKRHPKGRFLVQTKAHAVAIVNGKIYNNNRQETLQNQIVVFAAEIGKA